MQINGITIDAELLDIIEVLRAQLAEQGLNRFEKVTDSGTDIMVQCPYHKNGQERRPSAGIRKTDGLFHCLACGETHSLPEMIGFCFSRDAFFGYNWLTTNFGSFAEQERAPLTLNLSRSQQAETPKEYVSEDELDSYRYTHPYMYERGLTDEIIEKFDIGYDKQTDSITFPVRDTNGQTLFVVRRTVKYKSFYIPKNIEKPLYGYYEIVNQAKLSGTRLDKIYVCEGQFDCLRLWCNGKYAVAGFGCLYNQLQMRELAQLPTRHLVLALDNDEAGKDATDRLRRHISDKIITTVTLPFGRKDIGDCTDEEINNLHETFY